MRMYNPFSTVKQWDKVDALGEAFSEGLNNFFKDIYLPVKEVDSTTHKQKDTYSYINIGLSDSQLAQIYTTYFGKNFLIEPLVLNPDDITDYASAAEALGERIESVLLLNKQKYLKFIELLGYEWNPLWNVDGTESFTYLENQGINDVASKTKVPEITGYTNTYDGELRPATKTEYGTVETGYNGVSETTYTHKNAENGIEQTDVGKNYKGGTDEFGNTVVGGDKYHTEKKTRQGNIGVTKTTELLKDAQELFKSNVIKEFFKDINEQILIGVF